MPASGWSGVLRSEYTKTEDLVMSDGPSSSQVRAVVRQVTVWNIRDGRGTATTTTSTVSTTRMHDSGEEQCLVGTRRYTSHGEGENTEHGSGTATAVCTIDEESGSTSFFCRADGASFPTTRTEYGRLICNNCCPGSGPTEAVNGPHTTQSTESVQDIVFTQRWEDERRPEVLSGTQTSSDSYSNGHETASHTVTEHSTLTWFVEGEARPSDYELELEALEYDEFRPRAGVDEQSPGNTLALVAHLRRKDGAPLDQHAVRIVFRLSRRSFEPGVLMNWPPFGVARPTEPDLKFDQTQNAPNGLEIHGPDGLEARTVDGTYDFAQAIVTSYDWGAFGAVIAEAYLEDGEVVLSQVKGSPSDRELRIPKSTSADDPIAEVWRRAHQIEDSAISDQDDRPTGDGHLGDGLSLYEEYRGFRVNGVRVETDPRKKDLFIRNDMGAVAAIPLKEAGRITGLVVHSALDLDEYRALTREVSFNTTGTFQLAPKHALRVTRNADPTYAIAEGGPGTPAQCIAIRIPPKMPDHVGADPVTYFGATLLHEVAHCLNVWHHGEADDGEVWWVKDQQGDVFEMYPGQFETQMRVQLMHEDGVPRSRHPIQAYLGALRGTHSGDDSCVMRYDIASAYVGVATSDRYWHDGEPVGSKLCTSSAGTGVNSLHRAPMSRYGEAAAGRGNCLHQVCVNERHRHPSKVSP